MATVIRRAAAAPGSTAPRPDREGPSRLPGSLAFVVSIVFTVAALAFAFGLPHGAAGQPTSAGTTPAAGGATNTMPGMDMGSAVAANIVSSANVSRAATDVGVPITRTVPTTVNVNLTTEEVLGTLDGTTTYRFWTFNGTVPGPLLRVMQGDTVVVHLHNDSASVMPHSLDFHATSGPGGGAGVSQTAPGKDSTFSFKALHPGLYIYHCATQPVSMHIANGMYGMLLVEPPGGLPKVDKEFYVVQSELYITEPKGTAGEVHYSSQNMLDEHPT